MNTWLIGRDTPQQVLDYLLSWSRTVTGNPVVCFDYFDTLVVRNVEPEHTKRLAAKLQCILLEERFSESELYEFRRILELQLCELNSTESGNPEFHFIEFAKYLYKVLRQDASDVMDFWTQQEFAQTLLDIEVAVERSVQELLQETVTVLKGLKEKNLTTVLVSDFYIPEAQYREMLRGHGLLELFDHIFISTDYGEMKGTGALYRRICKELACLPQQMIMIGDNEHADVNMAGQEGIKALHVQNPKQRTLYDQWKNQGVKNKSGIEADFDRLVLPDTVFPEMGITLWYFIYKLFLQFREDGVRDVFFFSKEGQFLRRLFDRFQLDIFGHQVIRSHYIVVSRKATFLASLRPLEQEDFLRLFNHYRDIGLRDFLLSLNFSDTLARTICNEASLDHSTRYPDLRNQPVFARLLTSELFQREYERGRKQQKKNICEYLDSFGINYAKEGLHIVDVGWKGSIQDNIHHILDRNVTVHGYYIGSLIATELSETNLKKGILFSDRPGPSPFFNVYNSNRSLFEMILGASHGSADGYYRSTEIEQLDSEKHQSVFTTARCSNNEEIHVMVLDLPEERTLFREVIAPVQEEIYTLSRHMNRSFVTADCQAPSEKWFAKHHARMVYKPGEREIEWFEELYHLENFGVFEYTRFKSGALPSWFERMGHLKNILTDPPLLETGIWPPVILRRLGIGFYQKIDGFRRFRREFR